MSLPNTMLIDVNILVSQLNKSGTLEERLKCSMRLVKFHKAGLVFAFTEIEMLSTAVNGVMVNATDDERRRMTAEMRILSTLATLDDGRVVPVGSEVTGLDDPIGLLKLWHECEDD